ncbi:MAG: hypothetical protein Q9200_002155 [Gallowayella weberi]
MDLNGLLHDNDAFHEYRHLSPGSAEKIGKSRDFYECYNEATFLHTIWPMMMKDGYHLTKDRNDFTEEEKQNLLETQGTSYRDFLLHEGVVGAPLPDNIAALCGLAPGTWHAFFIVEGKGEGGSVHVAEDQVRGGGAALVNAHRQLKAKLGLLRDEAGPDEDTFVFSATITTRSIDFWVHWYEGPSATQKYHMNRVGEVSLIKNFKNHHHYNEIRQKLHNIVQWGAIDRFSELRTLHERIAGVKNKKAKNK